MGACFCVSGAANAPCSAAAVTMARFIAASPAPAQHALKSSGIRRINHIERMRRWRLRQKEQRRADALYADSVTHQGSQQAPTAVPVLSSSLSVGAEPLVTVEAAQTQWLCPKCAAALHPWVRPRFINRRRARASLRSAKAHASTDEAGAGPSPRSLPSKAQSGAHASE